MLRLTRPTETPINPLREQVRRHYAQAATAARAMSCCSDPQPCSESDGEVRFGGGLYATEAAGVATDVVSASLGCGVLTAVAELRPGEVVLDLGSGAGLDVIVSARRVGPAGVAFGLDMTAEMLELSRANAAAAGVTNVHFFKGYIEAIPLPDGSVDVVLSNCVINLSADKPAVFTEIARVTRSGGRLAISDVVANNTLSPQQRAERGSRVGCIAGALSDREYRAALADTGFEDIQISPTHGVADHMHATIVRARRT